MNVLFLVFFFESLPSSTNWPSCIVKFHMHVRQLSTENHGKISGVSVLQKGLSTFHWLLQQNVGESGYLISSSSGSTGYSASMLTEAKYPVLPDHDSMNNPSISTRELINPVLSTHVQCERALRNAQMLECSTNENKLCMIMWWLNSFVNKCRKLVSEPLLWYSWTRARLPVLLCISHWWPVEQTIPRST